MVVDEKSGRKGVIARSDTVFNPTDIGRLTPMGITWPIINVDGHIHHSVEPHDTEEDARGVMLILVSLSI